MTKPTNTLSKLKSKLTRELDPPPEAPARTYSPWEGPSPDNVESNATQRAEGQRALANATPPPEPVYGIQRVTGGSP